MSQLRLLNGRLVFDGTYQEGQVVKYVEGRRWWPEERVWELPLRDGIVEEVAVSLPGVEVAPEVYKAMQQRHLSAQILTQIKLDIAGAEPIKPMPIKAQPFKHQVAAYNFGLQTDNPAYLMEQGTGKTLTALAVVGRRFLDGQIKRVLIVAPAAVVPVWPKEFAEYADFDYDVLSLEGPVKARIKALEAWQPSLFLQVAVINYEATWRMEDELCLWHPDMIICDESQRIKTPSSAQSKCLHRLGRLAKYRLILTGTPVTQGPMDFFSQYKFLDPSIFGTNYASFKARYMIMGGFEGRQVIGYQRMPELIAKAHSVAFRVTKVEALDLPEQIDQTLYCELEPKARRIYNDLLRESVTELDNERVITAANVLSRLLRLSQLTGGYIGSGDAVDEVSHAKLKLLDDTLTDLLHAGKKVVVFARFTAEISAIRRLLEDKRAGYAWIAGEVAQNTRGEEVRRFQENDDCRVFIAQTRTAGLGITLTAADTAIFYSLDYSFADYDQARCRIHRIGQKNSCTYIHLLAKGTVDEKVLRILQQKRSVADDVVDHWRDYIKKEDD